MASATQTAKKDASVGYLPVAVSSLAPVDTLDFDLYMRPSASEPVVMFRERKYPLHAEDVERLVHAGVDTLYIRVAAHEEYCRYLKEEVIVNESVPPLRRFEVLSAVTRSAFENAFSSGSTDAMMAFADEVGPQMSNVITNEGLLLTDLLPLMTHDYYTYTHVANVCTYTIVLAKSVGYRDEATLHEISKGALLHDIGKLNTPTSVLNHQGRLSEEQWAHIQKHPWDGFRLMCERDDVSWGQLMMAYQHHERPDGKGYPTGATGPDIHEWANICKIADVFDALTSDRPYRKADSVDSVLEFLENRSGTEFDGEMVKCFRAILKCKS